MGLAPESLSPDAAARMDALIGRPGPALAFVQGPVGSGRRALLAALARPYASGSGGARGEAPTTPQPAGAQRPAGPTRVLWFEVLALPESVQARAFADTLLERSGTGRSEHAPEPGWDAAFDRLRDQLEAGRTPTLLIVDGVRHWNAGGAGAAFARFWTAVRARGLPLNVIMVGEGGERLPGVEAVEQVTLEHVPATQLREALVGWSARDRLLLWAALGGHVDRLSLVDPNGSLASNVRRLILDPAGPLHRAPLSDADARLQKPERYLGIMAALAEGAKEWGAIREAVPELGDGSRLAPYLATLEQMGWVVATASLDARPTSRRRRYSLRDPFHGFWFSSIAPVLGRCRTESHTELWTRHVRAALGLWAGRVLGRACGEALLTIGDQHLRARARQVGALWGDELDLPVAGTLFSGAAVVGTCTWGRAAAEADADDLDAQLRRTRFGFGRENRLRVVFSDGEPDEGLLRRAARDELLEVIRLDELF